MNDTTDASAPFDSLRMGHCGVLRENPQFVVHANCGGTFILGRAFVWRRWPRTSAKAKCPCLRNGSCESLGPSTVLSATARSSSHGMRSTSTRRIAPIVECVSRLADHQERKIVRPRLELEECEFLRSE